MGQNNGLCEGGPQEVTTNRMVGHSVAENCGPVFWLESKIIIETSLEFKRPTKGTGYGVPDL